MRSFFLALIVALSASSLAAQNWRDELAMVDKDLRTNHYGHARKWSIKVINSMSEHIGTGPAAMYSFALAVAYRAMAEAGLQKFDEADWYSHVALALYPRLARNDWSAYGEVGEWLTSKRHEDEVTTAEAAPARLPTRKTEPKCPLSAIRGGYFQPVTVGAFVDGDGTLKSPTLVSSTSAPTLVYAAFESLREFEFEPGTPVKYQVTVNFQPPPD